MNKNVDEKVKNLEDASDDLKETSLKGGHSCRSLGHKTWLITERAMNYIKIEPDFIFIIKKLDGREVKVNGEVVERID